jgi:hypothetical protein
MKRLNIKDILNSIAIQRDDMDSNVELDSAPSISEEPLTGIELFMAAVTSLFGPEIVETIKKWISKNKDKLDCLKLYDDPLIKPLLDELAALIRLYKEHIDSPEVVNVPKSIFDAIVNSDAAGDMLLNSIEEVLKRIKGLVADLSLGKCGKVWGDILSDILATGLDLPDWVKDVITKVANGLLDLYIAIGGILEKYSPQKAAAWAADCVVRQYGCQTTQGPTAGVDWGQVALWTTVGIGAVAIIVFTGGSAAPIALAVTGGAALTCSGAALADMSDSEIQQLIQERIEQQRQIIR